jgi:hypothetical protein
MSFCFIKIFSPRTRPLTVMVWTLSLPPVNADRRSC